MALVFSRPGGKLSVQPALLLKKGAIQKLFKQGARKAMIRIAREHRKLLQASIRGGSSGVETTGEGTRVARRFGKTAGVTPARPRRTAIKPLFYTGQSVRAIRVKIISQNQVEVSVPESEVITYSGGLMRDVVTFQERGFNQRGTWSKRQLAFLHIMLRNKSKVRGRKAQEDLARKARGSNTARAGVSYDRRVTARPAWRNALERIRPRAGKIIKKETRIVLRAAGFTVR